MMSCERELMEFITNLNNQGCLLLNFGRLDFHGGINI